MENDYLEDALRFIRGAIASEADTGRVSRFDLDRAREEIEKGIAKRREIADQVKRLQAALGPFVRYAEENDVAERNPEDAIEVRVIDLLAAKLAMSLTQLEPSGGL